MAVATLKIFFLYPMVEVSYKLKMIDQIRENTVCTDKRNKSDWPLERAVPLLLLQKTNVLRSALQQVTLNHSTQNQMTFVCHQAAHR